MAILCYIIFFSILGSIGATLGASFILFLSERYRWKFIAVFVSYATGTLLSSALLGMIPKAMKLSASPLSISATILTGIMLFFFLEKLVIWRHCHEEVCDVHTRAGSLILFGDAFHNFVDGTVIAAAFLTDIRLGIATALSVIAHEIPQEIGDFSILLQSGYTKRKAFLYNILSSCATLPGAFIAYVSLNAIQTAVPYILALSSAGFIYIALADLIPGLHRNPRLKSSVVQIVFIFCGIFTILFFVMRH
jgi:zinc and cadmium transporter